jgi:hypothetical protein
MSWEVHISGTEKLLQTFSGFPKRRRKAYAKGNGISLRVGTPRSDGYDDNFTNAMSAEWVDGKPVNNNIYNSELIQV